MTYLPRPLGLVLSLSMWLSACSRPPAVDAVVVGQDVAVTKADGGVVEGKVARLDDTNVQVTAGPTTTTIPKKQIVDVKVVDPAKPVNLPPAARFREYTVPAGTTLSLKLTTAINSGTNRVEDQVDAALAEPVTVGTAEVLPTGSIVKGTISAVQASEKVKGLDLGADWPDPLNPSDTVSGRHGATRQVAGGVRRTAGRPGGALAG